MKINIGNVCGLIVFSTIGCFTLLGSVYSQSTKVPPTTSIKSGTTLIWNDSDTSFERVEVLDFEIGIYEVTVAEFEQFTEDSGKKVNSDCPASSIAHERHAKFNWKKPGFYQTGNYPVVCVSWRDAQEYVKWLSDRTGKKIRLPTVAEWNMVRYPGLIEPDESEISKVELCNENIGDQSFANAIPISGFRRQSAIADNDSSRDEELEKKRKYYGADCEDGFEFTSPVGSFKSNKFGAHDLRGNVSEWMDGCNPPTAPGNPAFCRLKGGNWASGFSKSSADLKTGSAFPERGYQYIGFRIAISSVE